MVKKRNKREREKHKKHKKTHTIKKERTIK